MKSVLISIKPKYCELIVNGEKTIEVRKSRPKIETQDAALLEDLANLGLVTETEDEEDEK